MGQRGTGAGAGTWLLCALVIATSSSAAEIVVPMSRPGLQGVDPPHRSVYALLEDRDGYLWVGTLDGLGRYDGYQMLVFRHDPRDPRTLSNNSVHVLLEDSRGALWVGTESGLNLLDRTTMLFDRVAAFAATTGRGAWFTCAFEDRDGVIWFGTDHGLICHRPSCGGFELYRHDPVDPGSLPQAAVIGVQQDRSGALWVATSDGTAHSLSRFDPANGVIEQIPVAAAGRLFYTFLIDSNDRLWLHPDGTLDLATGYLDWSKDIDRPPGHSSRASLESSDGDVWIGCSDGLYRFTGGRGPAHRHLLTNRPGAWLENYVRSLHQGRSGILWVGTQGGIYRLDPDAKPFLHYGADPEQPGALSAVAVSSVVETSDGSFWIGTFGGGLNRLDPAVGVVQPAAAERGTQGPWPTGVVWDLQLDSRGVLWIAGNRLWSLGLGSKDVTDSGIAGTHPGGFSCVLEEPPGTLWLTGVDGILYRYRPAEHEIKSFPEAAGAASPWEGPRLDSLHSDGQRVWAAAGNRLCRLELDAERVECTPLETSDGTSLRSQGTWALHSDGDGSLWLGTSLGLLRYGFDDDFTLWTTHDGLLGSVVYSILEDDQGRLWLGTNQGLSCFDRRQPPGRWFRNYTTADGIGNVEFNRHAAVATSDGRFLFGGMDGLTAFDPDQIHDNSFVPPVLITDIEVWSRSGSRRVIPHGLERLILSHSDSTFGFSFAALSFTDPAHNHYAYRLAGFEEAWVAAGTRRTCQYTNIPPGRYRFQVRGANNDGLWNEEGAELPVIVRPAVWQTWWFRALVAVAGAGMIILAVAYRLARQRELQRLRLRIAGDLHDDLSSDLSGIAVVTDMVQRKGYLQASDRDDLAEVRDAALKRVDGVRDIVWYIDPEHDSFESLATRMRSVAGTLLRGLSHTFEVDPPSHSRPLPMTVRRNLFLVFKEALHNVVRHARANHVRIELTSDGHRLQLVISDDGQGFLPVRQARTGLGLRSMERRSAEIGACFKLDSVRNQGTRISVTLDMASSRDGGPPRGDATLSMSDEVETET